MNCVDGIHDECNFTQNYNNDKLKTIKVREMCNNKDKRKQ